MIRAILAALLCFSLIGCVTHHGKTVSAKHYSELEQGKRDFEQGYYRKALRLLLPLACDGDAEAQYAVGYQYYYGYGVAQDTQTGYFWIQRSANQGYFPAKKALAMINKGNDK